jgi:hypothetical protein
MLRVAADADGWIGSGLVDAMLAICRLFARRPHSLWADRHDDNTRAAPNRTEGPDLDVTAEAPSTGHRRAN